MIIKEAFLQEEKNKVISFLRTFDLLYDKDINKTFYIENDEDIIGTISISDYIIKDLAVSPLYQGENIASILINHVINYFVNNNIYNYQVFTKKEYKEKFLSLNFRLLIETDKLVMLEGGVNSIEESLQKIKKQLDIRFAPLDETSDIAAVVINGNPVTLGHEYLVERASKNHLMVVVFIVEEDKSDFSFVERLSMAYLTFHKYSNVYVLPSTKYIVSKLTFPSYFLKSDEVEEELSRVDALIFKKYFMKELFIKKRYIGTEAVSKMTTYNKVLKDELKEAIEIVDRCMLDGEVISARKVRNLLKEGNITEALKYIPNETSLIVRSVASLKFGKK